MQDVKASVTPKCLQLLRTAQGAAGAQHLKMWPSANNKGLSSPAALRLDFN